MSLKITVCIKSVVRNAPKGVARRTPDNCELNPFDRPALEAALQLQSTYGATVTALSMGPSTAGAALAEAQAMGADRAVLINDRALAESDTLVTARVLSRAIKQLGAFDLLFFGVRTSDSDTGQVGPQTAAVLDIPFVSRVKELGLTQEQWVVRRGIDDWVEQWYITLPVALTVDPRGFPPRPVGLMGISHAYRHPTIETMRLRDLNLTAQEVGLSGSPTRVAKLQHVKRKRSCEMLTGEPENQIEALVERLSHRGVMES